MKRWHEVGNDVFRLHYSFLKANVGVVVGTDGALVIDTRGSLVQGRQILEDVRKLTSLAVRWVVNTHFHWDHCWGNAAFQDAEIWAHSRCRMRLIQTAESQRMDVLRRMPSEMRKELEMVEIVAPEHLFYESALIDVGDRPVNLRFLGRGHTDSDIVVEVSDAEVLFGGDLIWEGDLPAFRDSYPLDWPSSLKALLEGPVRQFIPGHGDTVDYAFLQDQLQELEVAADAARRCSAGEITAQDAVAGGPFPPSEMEIILERAMRQLS